MGKKKEFNSFTNPEEGNICQDQLFRILFNIFGFFGYFNDSYFWVVNRTLGVKEAKDQLITWSVTSTIAWAVGVVEVLVLNIFM